MVICHPYAGTSRNATPDDKEMNEVKKGCVGISKTVMLIIHGVPLRHAVNCKHSVVLLVLFTP